MSESTTVWLIRHGLTEGADGRCCGRFDVRLSAGGIQQANAIAKRLSGESISHVYSSNLSRAVETARIIVAARGLTVQTIDDLAEMNFGDLEGLTVEEVQAHFPDVYQSWMTQPNATQFPNGECFTQMRARVLGILDSLLSRHRKQSIAIVTHAGVIRVMLAEVLSIPAGEIFRLAQHYGAINRIAYFDHGPVVELMNG